MVRSHNAPYNSRNVDLCPGHTSPTRLSRSVLDRNWRTRRPANSMGAASPAPSSWDAPGGTGKVDLALQEIQEERRVVQAPFLPPSIGKGLAENFACALDT